MRDTTQIAYGDRSAEPATAAQEIALRAPDGTDLSARVWAPAQPKRVVLCIHGLGGHGGYYQQLAGELVTAETAVIAPDLRGHGRSGGARGDIEHFERYLEDVNAAVRWARSRWPGTPLIMLGESMGASIALHYLAKACYLPRSSEVAGLVLVSPVLRAAIRPTLSEVRSFLRLLLTAPSRPGLPVTGREELGCRDDAFNAELRADPLFVRLVSARFLLRLTQSLRRTGATASRITIPLLLMQGGCDYVAHPAGTSRFLARVATGDRTVARFPEAYHCLFRDPASAEVVAELISWLERYQPTRDER